MSNKININDNELDINNSSKNLRKKRKSQINIISCKNSITNSNNYKNNFKNSSNSKNIVDNSDNNNNNNNNIFNKKFIINNINNNSIIEHNIKKNIFEINKKTKTKTNNLLSIINYNNNIRLPIINHQLIKKNDVNNNNIKIKNTNTFSYKDYEYIENKKLIKVYGPELFNHSIKSEVNYNYIKEDRKNINKDNKICFNYNDYKLINILEKHKISSFIRTKLVDWLFEVLIAYNSEESTIYLTFHILDYYIYKCQTTLSNSDIHLIGITSLFIASKTEALIPLDLQKIKTKIAHDKFKTFEIINKEKTILKSLDFNLFITSMHDFIKNFIFDLLYNNRKAIKKIKLKTLIDLIEKVSIYISKILIHSDYFSQYKNSLKAITCIIVSFDLIRSNKSNFTNDMINFVHEWIKFLIEHSNYDPLLINSLYNYITDYYTKFEDLEINHNLKKSYGNLFD